MSHPQLPTLHQTCSFETALAAFQQADRPQVLCDGQFVVLPTDVLCFVTVGNPLGASHLQTPSVVVWKPQRLDYVADQHRPWLPEEVREAQRQHKAQHVFIRAAATEDFRYAGIAHLGSYGDGPGGKEARFYLIDRLPRDAWLHLGGYPGWLVDVNHSVQRLNQADQAGFAALLDGLPQQGFSHLSLTRYEDDSLHLYLNERCGWLMYLRFPEDSGIYIRDSGDAGEAAVEEEFRCICGIALEFPTYQTLPRDQALDVARAFFATGRLPNTVDWEVDQFGSA